MRAVYPITDVIDYLEVYWSQPPPPVLKPSHISLCGYVFHTFAYRSSCWDMTDSHRLAMPSCTNVRTSLRRAVYFFALLSKGSSQDEAE